MIISNTEINTYNICEKQHHFRFRMGLEPKVFNRPLTSGIIGHVALECFYRKMMEGASVDQCKKAAIDSIKKSIDNILLERPEDFDDIQQFIRLIKLIEGYTEVYRQEQFKVLAVEKVFTTPVIPGIDYGMKLDLLVEMISGEYRGDIVVVDHKFVYNFKTLFDIGMDGQIPKYIKTLQDNGYTVTKGLFNQIRTRQMRDPNPSDIYRRTWLKSNHNEVARVWQEQEYVANRIYANSAMPVEQSAEYAPRTMSPLVCRSCMFQGPCTAELGGDDITQMLTANYRKSSYGYTEINEDS